MMAWDSKLAARGWGLTWQRCKYMNEAADPAEWQKASVPEVPWSV